MNDGLFHRVFISRNKIDDLKFDISTVTNDLVINNRYRAKY